jgi:SAM-dependent methyltransferase
MVDIAPDFGRTAEDYARHRAGFPPELIERLKARGIGRAPARVADLGTGTGSLARLFAQCGCEVTGVDVAAPLLEQAGRLDREAGVSIRYVAAGAEATGLPSAAFDVVSAGQCWHWFDRPAAAREVARLLVRGGAVVIAHFDWLPIAGNVVAATEEIILRYTPTWPFANRAGLYPQWLTDIQSAGFTHIETFSFDVVVPYPHDAWIGRVRASAPVAGTLAPERVESCSKDLSAMLRSRFPEDPLAVPHRVWAVTARWGGSSCGGSTGTVAATTTERSER